MAVKIDSLEQMVESYIVNSIRENHPEVDATPGSVLYDMMISPLISVLTPFIENINKYELSTDLVNAPYMTEDELDKVGENNYFITRNAGKKATGTVSFSVTEILPGNDFIVPIGTVVSTTDSIRFRTTVEYRISSSEALPYYNNTTFMYELPVPAEAVEIGAESNVEAGRIVMIETVFNSKCVGVTNNTPFTGGEAKESNESYVERIKSFYTNNFLGTVSGYENIVKNNYPEVEDIRVVGFRDKFMHRDKGQYELPDGTLYEGNIGGKVDLYIKGANIDEEVVTMEITNGRKRLNNKFIIPNDDWNGLKTVVIRESDLDAFYDDFNTPNIKLFHSLVEDVEDNDGKTFCYVEVPENVILQENLEGETLLVLYDYKFDSYSDSIYRSVESFKIYPMEYTLNSPIVNPMISLTNKTTGEVFNVHNHPTTYYTQVTTVPTAPAEDKLTYRGTALEEVTIKFKRDKLGFNGETLEHVYTKNLTISGIDDVINLKENRIITTDTLVRPADIKYVNMKIRVKPDEGHSLTEVLNDRIYKIVSDHIASLQLGETLDESNLISDLYAGSETIKDYVDYIELPFKSFYAIKESELNDEVIEGERGDFLVDVNGYDTDFRQQNNLPIRSNEIQYIKLNKLIIEEIL